MRLSNMNMQDNIEKKYTIGSSPESKSIEIWSVMLLSYYPKDWRKALRANIQAALSMLHCGPQDILRGLYAGNYAADAENILFYNLGQRCFSHTVTRGLKFERTSTFVRPPQALGETYAHYYRYAVVGIGEGFAHWNKTQVLASWEPIAIPRLTSETNPAHIWYPVASNPLEVLHVPEQKLAHFGISIILTVPSSVINVTLLLKPLLDGLISAFHSHTGEKLEEFSCLLGSILRVEPLAIEPLLLQHQRAILGSRALLSSRKSRSGIQWQPADDLCVACEVFVQRHADPQWWIAGSLFAVEDRLQGLTPAT